MSSVSLSEEAKKKYRECQSVEGFERRNREKEPDLAWAMNRAEQALIGLYEPHFNETNNFFRSPLPPVYDGSCLCKDCSRPKVTTTPSSDRNEKSKRKRRWGGEKERYSRAPALDSLDRICWELSLRPEAVDEGTEQALLSVIEYLENRLTRPKRVDSNIYAWTSSRSAVYYPLTKWSKENSVNCKLAIDRHEKERIEQLVMESRLSFTDLLWSGNFDREATLTSRFLYLYHDGKEVFYIGASTMPRSRIMDKFGLMNHRKDTGNDFVKFFDRHRQIALDNWYMSTLTLEECESLVLYPFFLMEEDNQ